jgi:outer membrane protein assembly factor BamB
LLGESAIRFRSNKIIGKEKTLIESEKMNTNFLINTGKIRGYKNRYKNAFYGVSLILLFAFSIVMAFAPSALGQKISAYPVPRVTGAYAAAAPSVIGVSQTLTVNLWVQPPPQDAAGSPNGLMYSGFTVTFTRPDGTTDTFVPTDHSGLYPAGQCDPLGGLWFQYTPNVVGNWSVKFTMPAQNLTYAGVGTAQYAECTSSPAYFTVTTEAQNAGVLNGWPWSPLPNSDAYWTYPISANNREWAAISGNWLSGGQFGGAQLIPTLNGNYQPYGSGISTGHILWDNNMYFGGIVGGDYGSISYEGYTSNMATNIVHVIMAGKLYVNLNTADNKFNCFDLTTGKLLYTATGTINGGIFLPGNDYAQSTSGRGFQTNAVLGTSFGAAPTPYLFSAVSGANNAAGLPTTVWNYYDPINGALRRSITNVTASTYNFFDHTEFAFGITNLNFNITTDKYAVNYAWKWNITKVVNNDWYTGLVWKTQLNGPGPKDLGPGDGAGRTALFLSSDMSTMVVGGSAGNNWAAGFNTQTGAWLWNLTLPYTAQIAPAIHNSKDWIIYNPTGATLSCYDMLTGTMRWTTPNVGTYPWNTRATGVACSDETNYYMALPSGEIVALSLATGKILWTSKAIATTESSANVLSMWQAPVEVGGYIYSFAGYAINYEIDPIQRFSVLVCLNATTGETVWTLNGGIYPLAAAAGYLTGLSLLDGKIYCLGKGQTSTSVSVQNNVIAQGGNVLIEGNVLDQSPAQPGTPAVSDASMNEYMDYLNFNNATLLNSPPTPNGVQVTLTAVDPNMNTVSIGTTTTDSTGNYYVNWTPQIEGQYTITAKFAGSGSYWPSSSETGIIVNPAPAATSAPTTTTNADVTTPIYIVGIALAIVIIIVGAVIVLLQRKRP